MKVNLYRKCRFWPDSGHCVLRDCQVQDCAISEIPIGLRESSYDKIINPQAVVSNCGVEYTLFLIFENICIIIVII